MTKTTAPTVPIPSLASPAVTTRPAGFPEQDHPLYSLFVQHHALRELAIAADRSCQNIAPSRSTLDEPDPLDSLQGEERDRYLSLRQQRETYQHAAYLLELAIGQLVDSLEGM